MVKLHPPVINETVPAFTTKILKVSFLPNSVVSKNEVIGMGLLIKDLFGNNVENNNSIIISNNYRMDDGVAYFNLLNCNLILGDYYKVQLAYIGKDNSIGYFSNTGITKYSSSPKVYISNLASGNLNQAAPTYVGVFEQTENNDITEKLYSSYFCIYDFNNKLLFQSDEKIHNFLQDEQSNLQTEIFNLNSEIILDQKYYIEFNTLSLNGIKSKSIKYKITTTTDIPLDFTADLIAENNFEEGYIKLQLKNCSVKSLTGNFLLSRINLKTGAKVSIKIFNFLFMNMDQWSYIDLTVEQGQEYQYCLQQFNKNNIYSIPLYSNPIISNFEYIYLTDGKKQLKIKYNPIINSFKDVILENKLETIGSKYPFIFRNSIVKYKEFPISGLISYLSDESNLFVSDNQQTEYQYYQNLIDKFYDIQNQLYSNEMTTDQRQTLIEQNNIIANKILQYFKKELNNSMIIDNQILSFNRQGMLFLRQFKNNNLNFNTNLTLDNFTKEREWKLSVLDWLNNGEIKLFKSPAEGNYLIRLVNVSLTPEKALGRMIHSFQATAYEIAESNLENLLKYNLIQVADEEIQVTTWSSWNLIDYLNSQYPLTLNTEPILGLKLTGFIPGDQIEILVKNTENAEVITIGQNGAYFLDDVEIERVRLLRPLQSFGTIDYKHYLSSIFSFSNIENIIFHSGVYFSEFGYNSPNIYYLKNNFKFSISQINFIQFEKLNIIDLETLPPESQRNCLTIYHIVSQNKYYDFNGNELVDFSLDNCYNFKYNNNELSLKGKNNQTIPFLGETEIDIELGYAVKLNLGFSLKEIRYAVEDTNEELQELWQLFLQNKTQENYENYLNALANTLKIKEDN